jgi:hypothetical protein
VDEPNPNLADGTSVEKVFYDFLMCGDQVTDSVYPHRRQQPADVRHTRCQRSARADHGKYQLLKSIDPKTEQSVVCNFQNTDAVNANHSGLKALQAYLGCGH